jgi:tumor protein p63
MCQNSCIGGNGKIGKPIQLLVTLENSGNILARQKLEIKVCACPKRDLKKDEKLSAQLARSPSLNSKFDGIF